jgi:hypothetical protein
MQTVGNRAIIHETSIPLSPLSPSGFEQSFPTPESTSTLQLLRRQQMSTHPIHTFELFCNVPTLMSLEAPLVPAPLQPFNPGSFASFMPHQPTVPSHSCVPPAFKCHSHGDVPPAFGGIPYDSYASHAVPANEPSSLHSLTTFADFQQHTKSHRATCDSRRKRLSLPLKGRSNTKRKQCSTSGSRIARPLTLYNFFFRVERHRLLQEVSSATSETVVDPTLSLQEFYNGVLRDQSSFIEQVLQDQWSRDPSHKRKHQKVHGKISFESMTRRIATNWQALPDAVKDLFRQISARDHRRYDQEVRNAALMGADE